MLYTGFNSNTSTYGTKSIYYIAPNQGNDDVAPDPQDLHDFQHGNITWKGFYLNYLATLMRSQAHAWMEQIAHKAVHQDVILVDDEQQYANSPRKILAELILNMFSGHMPLQYGGELPSTK
jgi:uncharacterized protein YeaO (DUF488 family)